MGWIVVATCVCLMRSIWVRRWTLTSVSDHLKLTERTLTVCLLCQLAALILMSPISDEAIGRPLHALTGHWNIDSWAGHCCFIGAAATITLNVGSRLDISHQELLKDFKRRIEMPMTIIIPALLAILFMSPNANQDTVDLFAAKNDFWLNVYWTLVSGFLIYILAHAMGVLAIIRRDPRNRRTATLYLIALSAGAGVCTLRIIASWSNSDFNYHPWFWIGDCTSSMIFAWAAAQSWRKRVSWLRGGDHVARNS